MILLLFHPTSGHSEIHFFEIHSEIAEIYVSGIIALAGISPRRRDPAEALLDL